VAGHIGYELQCAESRFISLRCRVSPRSPGRMIFSVKAGLFPDRSRLRAHIASGARTEHLALHLRDHQLQVPDQRLRARDLARVSISATFSVALSSGRSAVPAMRLTRASCLRQPAGLKNNEIASRLRICTHTVGVSQDLVHLARSERRDRCNDWAAFKTSSGCLLSAVYTLRFQDGFRTGTASDRHL
jgi:hypothetical protein